MALFLWRIIFNLDMQANRIEWKNTNIGQMIYLMLLIGEIFSIFDLLEICQFETIKLMFLISQVLQDQNDWECYIISWKIE